MSTKTLLKRVSLGAVVALTAGLVSAVPSVAVISNVTASPATASAGNGSSVSTTVCFDGGNGDSATITITDSGTGTTAWSLAPQDNPPLTFSALSGTAPTTSTSTVTKSNASNQCFIASFVTTGKTNGDLVTLAVGATTAFTLTSTASVTPGTTDTPWFAALPGGPSGSEIVNNTNRAAITVTNRIDNATDYVILRTDSDTVAKNGLGSFRYVSVTGSTIQAYAQGTATSPILLNGAVNVATQAAMPLDGNIFGTTDTELHINANVAGTITVTFMDRVETITGFPVFKTLQTITITVAAPSPLDPNASTAHIVANSNYFGTAGGVASSGAGCAANPCTTSADETIVASRVAKGLSTLADAVATIKVSLLGLDGNPLVGVLPSVGAEVTGPGTVNISATAYGVSLTGGAGRNVGLANAPGNVFYINIFADGNNGASSIAVKVGGSTWRTETLGFYGTVAKVAASQKRFVLEAGTTAAKPNQGCANGATSATVCTATTVLNSPAVILAATDDKSIAVPYLTYTATTSDATVLSAVTTATVGQGFAHWVGVQHFQVSVPLGGLSGKSAALTYSTGTLAADKALTFALGDAAASVTMSVTGSGEVGRVNTLSVTTLDSSKNKAFDKDHAAALASNTAITAAVNSNQCIFNIGSLPTPGCTSTSIPVWNGTGSVDFFNPLVPGEVKFTGTVGGAAVAASYLVSNSAVDDATAAALEAKDAADAATDAANLAIEAADAATAAAEEARDAADAATAAVEALATEVAALIASLKAQLTTMAKVLAKIAKKVKA